MGNVNVLFVCTGNICRSQIAEAIGNFYSRKYSIPINFSSAGIRPGEKIPEEVFLVLKEKGIEFSGYPKKIDPEKLKNFDYVISVCSANCFVPPDVKFEVWDVEDPFGESIDFFRKVRDEIEWKVLELIERITKDGICDKKKEIRR